MGSEPQWVEREILDAFYQIAVDFRSGFVLRFAPMQYRRS